MFMNQYMRNITRVSQMARLSFSTIEKQVESTLVKHPHNLNIREGTQLAETNVFAVVRILGRQFKVTKDDVIVADAIDKIDIGQSLTFKDVLMVGGRHGTIIGRPQVPGASVVAEVEEITLDKKVLALKFRRRKSSRRLTGHRREVTILRITDILPPQDLSKDLNV